MRCDASITWGVEQLWGKGLFVPSFECQPYYQFPQENKVEGVGSKVRTGFHPPIHLPTAQLVPISASGHHKRDLSTFSLLRKKYFHFKRPNTNHAKRYRHLLKIKSIKNCRLLSVQAIKTKMQASIFPRLLAPVY